MTPVEVLLTVLAGMFVVAAAGERLFQRTGIPDAIWLVVAGVVLGPVSGALTRDRLSEIAPYLAAVTLVMILFQGGLGLKLKTLVHSAPRASVIALVGFAFTVVAVAGASAVAVALGLAPEGWSYLHGVLLGTILGGSSSIVVMPAMAQAKVRSELAELLDVESALTDILCVVFTVAVIDVLLGRTSRGGDTGLQLLQFFAVGAGLGVASGLLLVLVLRLVKLGDHEYPVTLAALLGLFVMIERAGGSPALGIFTVAVILGNSKSVELELGMRQPEDLPSTVVATHKQLTFIIKTLFFVFLGAMLGPPWTAVAVGVALGGLLLIVRAPAVYLGTLGTDLSRTERRLAAAAVPRGLAAGVLATLPVTAGVGATSNLPAMVFAAVITSIVLFTLAFGLLGRRAASA